MSIFNSSLLRPKTESLHALSGLLCAGLMIISIYACSVQPPQYPVEGDAFPLVELNQLIPLQNTTIDTRDKTLLISFWATWCEPCRREMPDLEKLSVALDNNKYKVIGISVDEDSNLAKEFLLQHNIRFSNFLDENRQLANNKLGIKAFPIAYIISPEGLILKLISGQQSWQLNNFQKLILTPQQDTVTSSLKELRRKG